jgi:hypothetical protein
MKPLTGLLPFTFCMASFKSYSAFIVNILTLLAEQIRRPSHNENREIPSQNCTDISEGDAL